MYKTIFDDINSYIFHDSEIRKIMKSPDSLLFLFDKGVYAFDVNESDKRSPDYCQMEIKIDDFDMLNMHEHIEVILQSKNKLREIKFEKLLEMMKKESLIVDMIYCSNFGGALLIKCRLNSLIVSMTITEIIDTHISFSSEFCN